METSIKYLDDNKVIGYDSPGESILIVAKIPDSKENPGGLIGKYHLKCFKCGFICHLGKHTVEIIDEKVTLTPSVLCPIEKCKEHYWIRNGTIVSV